MSTYQTKPIMVEAVRYTGRNLDEVEKFLGGLLVGGPVGTFEMLHVYSDKRYAFVGDWLVIKETRLGPELEVLDDISFSRRYEPVD